MGIDFQPRADVGIRCNTIVVPGSATGDAAPRTHDGFQMGAGAAATISNADSNCNQAARAEIGQPGMGTIRVVTGGASVSLSDLHPLSRHHRSRMASTMSFGCVLAKERSLESDFQA